MREASIQAAKDARLIVAGLARRHGKEKAVACAEGHVHRTGGHSSHQYYLELLEWAEAGDYNTAPKAPVASDD
ncbi:MAG: hypothetical protein HRU20_26055 [Pseudomonadales bacterium]|nr:hypothetical protein [Pseudomonadales bacterium]